MKKGDKVKLKNKQVNLIYIIDEVITCKTCNQTHLKLVNHCVPILFPKMCTCKKINIPLHFTTYESSLFEEFENTDLEINDILKKLNL